MQDYKLPKGKYVFEWGGLMANAGGMTRAMLKRANVFIQEGTDVTILLSARGMEQLDVVSHYKGNGYPEINESNFVVMEDWLATQFVSPQSIYIPEEHGSLKELDSLPHEDLGNKRKYYKDGELYAEETSEKAEWSRKIICYDKDTKYCYTEMYWDGILRRRIFKDQVESDGKKYRTEKFYSSNGFCFMVIKNYNDGKHWTVDKIKLFSEKNHSVIQYKSMDELRQVFFSEYVKSCADNNIFVFCDPFLDFQAGFKYMHCDKKIYRIGINHGVGLGGEKKWYSQVNPRIETQIINSFPPEIDAYVLLTKEALSLWKKRLGNCNYLYQIPNTMSIPKQISGFQNRDINKVVYIGRFDEKQKQISHAIRAFAIVSKTNPHLHFHIYGRGDDKQTYEKLISELQMQDKIYLEPFTNDVSGVYQHAGFSLCTSSFEGFSLSLLESMANGCPMISYDCCYGPKDSIIDGFNGFLVQSNNIDEMAKKIEQLANNSELLSKMSKNAYESVQKYDESHYLNNWKELLNTVITMKH